jgi:hypothetical protein
MHGFPAGHCFGESRSFFAASWRTLYSNHKEGVIESDTTALVVCRSVGLQAATASVIRGGYSAEEAGTLAAVARTGQDRLTACNFLTGGESYLGRAWLKEH